MFPKDLSAGQIPYLLIFERCAEQYLMRDEGKARNAWAKKCFPQIDIAAYEKQEPPMYALVFSPSSKSWKGPTDAYASCGDWEVKAMCVFACYPFEERVHFSGGYEAIGEAYDKQRMSLLTMQAESSLSRPEYVHLPVKAYSRSHVEASERIKIISTKGRKKIRITLDHPVLLSTGQMVEAKAIKVGDYLVDMNGRPDEVRSVIEQDYFGRVYNVAPDSGHPKENILLAEGLLMGSASYQYLEKFQSLMYRRLFRETLDVD